MNKILLLDNYDSFTYNLYHLVQINFSGIVEVKRDYEIKMEELDNYNGLIISPGPGRPETTPMAMELINKLYNKVPILGICLGMQCINEFFDGTTTKSNFPVHGKTSVLRHSMSSIFKDIPQNINVARYHSLTCNIGHNLEIIGETSDSIIMAIRHILLPIYGLQFHPESFLSEYGDKMIINFLEVCNI